LSQLHLRSHSGGLKDGADPGQRRLGLAHLQPKDSYAPTHAVHQGGDVLSASPHEGHRVMEVPQEIPEVRRDGKEEAMNRQLLLHLAANRERRQRLVKRYCDLACCCQTADPTITHEDKQFCSVLHKVDFLSRHGLVERIPRHD